MRDFFDRDGGTVVVSQGQAHDHQTCENDASSPGKKPTTFLSAICNTHLVQVSLVGRKRLTWAFIDASIALNQVSRGEER